jgi:hypothetical protein
MSFSFKLPMAAGPGDFLWFIVSDDMQPMAYRAGVPANNVTANIDMPDRTAITGFVMRTDLQILDTQKDMVKVPGSQITAKPKQSDQADSQDLKSLKDTITSARKELRDYAEAREMAVRQERGLYKLSRNIGDLKAAGEEDQIFFKRPIVANTTEPVKTSRSDTNVVQFEQWKNRIRQNTGITRQLSDSDAAALRNHTTTSARVMQQWQEAGRRLHVVRNQLQAANARVLTGQQEAALRAETQKAVVELDKALAAAIGDASLVNHLREQNELLQKISGSSGGFIIAREQQIVVQPREMQRLERAAQVPNISGRWRSNIRAVYDIKQNGTAFTWTKLGTQEIGQGTIEGTTIRASWRTGNRPPGSSNGAIVEVDNAGVAQRIRWENGVVFFR